MSAYICHSCGGEGNINCDNCPMCVLKEIDEYLSEHKLNYIGHRSKLHIKVIDTIHAYSKPKEDKLWDDGSEK